jgi:hypothetical protein
LVCTAEAGPSLVRPVPERGEKKVVQAGTIIGARWFTGLQKMFKPILLIGAIDQLHG